MKETGVIRRIDELGRIVIPKEIRNRLRVGPGDMLDIFTQDKTIVLKKYSLLNESDEHLNNMLNALKDKKIDFVVCTKNEVVESTISHLKHSDELEVPFLNLFVKNLELELPPTSSVEIVKGYSPKKYLCAKRMYQYGDLIAHIILLSDEPLMKNDKEKINIIERYLKNYLIGE